MQQLSVVLNNDAERGGRKAPTSFRVAKRGISSGAHSIRAPHQVPLLDLYKESVTCVKQI